MKVLNQIKDMLCDELEDITKRKDLSPNSLDIIDTAVDVIKDIDTIHAMEKEYPEVNGYSQGYYGRMPIYMYDDGMTGGSYSRGRNMNVARDSRGSYSAGGYSGDTKEELQRLMESAKDDREREAIRNALDRIR